MKMPAEVKQERPESFTWNTVRSVDSMQLLARTALDLGEVA